MNKLPSPLPRLTGDRINLLVKKIKRGRREGEGKREEGKGKRRKGMEREGKMGGWGRKSSLWQLLTPLVRKFTNSCVDEYENEY